MRAGDWKYMYQFESGVEKLYDLMEDPLEMIDLTASKTELCEKLNRRLADWFKNNGAHFLVHHTTGLLRKNLKT